VSVIKCTAIVKKMHHTDNNGNTKPVYAEKIFSRFVMTTYFLLSNQLYNNLFS